MDVRQEFVAISDMSCSIAIMGHLNEGIDVGYGLQFDGENVVVGIYKP